MPASIRPTDSPPWPRWRTNSQLRWQPLMADADEFVRLAAEKDQQRAGIIEGAGEMFAVYETWVAAGFTSEQATAFCITLLQESLRGGRDG